jgi:multiple sugar transport system ATP-binding protein
MAKIVLKDLWKKYGDVEAVKGVNLEIKDGEFFSFLGPSGCGKTSTMRMIAGLEEITSGEIWIGDRLVNDLTPAERDVAMAFETYALYPPLTVRQNLAFPLQAQGADKETVAQKVEEVARILQLTDVLDKYPRETSGGHQQRISLGRCIVRTPNVYLFDEPLSHVDSEARREMRGEVKRLQQTFATTAIWVTHDQLEAVALADRIAVMNFGEFQQVGTAEEIYHHPRNVFVASFIGEPPFNFLDGRVVTKNGGLAFQIEGFDYTVPVPDHLKERVADRAGELLKVGIRPMYMIPTLTEQEDSLVHGQVYVFEQLGEKGVLTVELDGQLHRIVTTPDFAGTIGDAVWLSFDTSRVHVFDPETELNLLAG